MVDWKIVALVFIAIALIEGLFIVYIFGVGNAMYANEEKCAYEVCEDAKYDAYTYDEASGMCYCWEGERTTLEKQL